MFVEIYIHLHSLSHCLNALYKSSFFFKTCGCKFCLWRICPWSIFVLFRWIGKRKRLCVCEILSFRLTKYAQNQRVSKIVYLRTVLAKKGWSYFHDYWFYFIHNFHNNLVQIIKLLNFYFNIWYNNLTFCSTVFAQIQGYWKIATLREILAQKGVKL